MKQSLHSFHRGLALLLVVMLLASLMLPAAASAEGILSGADTGQELPLETGGAGGRYALLPVTLLVMLTGTAAWKRRRERRVMRE